MNYKKYYIPAAFTLLIIALFIFLFFAPVFYPTLQSSIPELPPSGENDDSTPGNVVQNDTGNTPLTVTRENVQSVIAALKRPTEYFYETRSELKYTGGTQQYLRRKWVREDVARVDIMNSINSVETHVVYAGDYVYMWRPGYNDYYRAKAGDFTADDTQMIMVYEDILELDVSRIKDAQYTMYEGSPCIYVEAENGDLNYRERYWVSVENGLLLYGQTLSGDDVVYSVKASNIDISPQDKSLFLLPDGKPAAG